MKYAINREFGIFRYFCPPVSKPLLKVANPTLSALPKGMNSSKSLEISKRKIPCSDGEAISAFVIRPKDQDGAQSAILYLHGGGFVIKAAPHHYKLAKQYALKTHSTVIFVDYRLAFDTPYGVPLQDCVDAYRYVSENGDKLNIDKENISIAGDSAGGYLCLALVDRCKELGMPLPKKQMLVYPVVDPEMSTESMKEFPDTPMWNAKRNEKMWAIYAKGHDAYNPLHAELSYLPMTYVETAEFDCLRDEGELLASKLAESGVECVLNETKGTMHGFDICLSAPTSVAAIEKRIAFLTNKIN